MNNSICKGERNNALNEAAWALNRTGMSRDEAENLLRDAALSNGTGISEFTRTVRSAYNRRPDKPLDARINEGFHGLKYSTRRLAPPSTLPVKVSDRKDIPDMPLPKAIPDGARLLLKTLFQPEEPVRISQGWINEDGDGQPDAGSNLTRDEWLQKLDENNGDPKPVWMRIGNPGVYVGMNPSTGSKDEHVTCYRHCLVEWDNLPLKKQWALIVESRLPVAAVIHTGNKSLHAIVKIDADSREQYDERVAFVYERLEKSKPDPANKNPGRLTRMPGAKRGVSTQLLIALNIGAASYADWADDAVLPHELDLDAMKSFDPLSDPNSLIGTRWLCKGAMAILSGQSGTGKSCLLMQMALTWALGREFFGIKPARPLKIVIVQAENDSGDMSEMFQGICEKLGVDMTDPAQMANLKNRVKIFKESSRTGLDFVLMMERVIHRHQPDVVFADPLLTYVGDDVSKQPVVSKFLRNWLNPVIEKSGVVWIWMHHTAKPSADPKAKTNWTEADLAYSGFGSSELVNMPRTTMQLLRDPKSKGVFGFSISKRTNHGMTGYDGKPANLIYLKHCDDRRANGTRVIFWERSDYTPSEPTKIGKVKIGKVEVARTGNYQKAFLEAMQGKPATQYKGLVETMLAACGEEKISKSTAERRLRELEHYFDKTEDGQFPLYRMKAPEIVTQKMLMDGIIEPIAEDPQ